MPINKDLEGPQEEDEGGHHALAPNGARPRRERLATGTDVAAADCLLFPPGSVFQPFFQIMTPPLTISSLQKIYYLDLYHI